MGTDGWIVFVVLHLGGPLVRRAVWAMDTLPLFPFLFLVRLLVRIRRRQPMQEGGRSLPRIPPVAFGAREVLPVNWNEVVPGGVHVSVYRRQRLLRALGCLPVGVICRLRSLDLLEGVLLRTLLLGSIVAMFPWWYGMRKLSSQPTM